MPERRSIKGKSKVLGGYQSRQPLECVGPWGDPETIMPYYFTTSPLLIYYIDYSHVNME